MASGGGTSMLLYIPAISSIVDPYLYLKEKYIKPYSHSHTMVSLLNRTTEQ